MPAKGTPSPRRVDLTGHKAGSLTVIKFSHTDGKKTHWHVRCECGSKKVMPGHELTRTTRIRAGCGHRCSFSKKAIGEKNTTHGMSKHPAFGVWHSMKQRCMDKNHPAFKNYGGRGITVCKEWQNSFESFWSAMGPTWRKGLDIDRRDNDAGYSPENCRWVTRQENTRNKRTSVTPDHILDAAMRNKISRSTLYWRIGRGVKPEIACSKKADGSARFSTSETVARATSSSCSLDEDPFWHTTALRQ
jgi:hypothetical protein